MAKEQSNDGGESVVQRIPIRQLLRHMTRLGTSPGDRRLAALAVLATSLLIPSAAAGASQSVTPVIRGTLGANGWDRTGGIVHLAIQPLPDSTRRCDAFTLTADTRGTARKCFATWGGTTIRDNGT